MERDHNKTSPKDDGGDRGGNDNSDSHSSTNTPPPRPVAMDLAVSSSFPVTPTTINFVSSSPQTSTPPGRKRTRAEEKLLVGESSSGNKGKKKGELTDPPSSDPKCATCGKIFGSWKAVFGHLRSHPERDYRGAFPPPKIWEEMLLQQEAAARQQQYGQDHGQGGSSSTVAAGRSGPTSGRGIGIDLNDPEEGRHKEGFPFDLNMPAPETESEEEEDHKDNKKN